MLIRHWVMWNRTLTSYIHIAYRCFDASSTLIIDWNSKCRPIRVAFSMLAHHNSMRQHQHPNFDHSRIGDLLGINLLRPLTQSTFPGPNSLPQLQGTLTDDLVRSVEVRRSHIGDLNKDALRATQLRLISSPLPINFAHDADELYSALIRRWGPKR